jgi:hypothetical protein
MSLGGVRVSVAVHAKPEVVGLLTLFASFKDMHHESHEERGISVMILTSSKLSHFSEVLQMRVAVQMFVCRRILVSLKVCQSHVLFDAMSDSELRRHGVHSATYRGYKNARSDVVMTLAGGASYSDDRCHAALTETPLVSNVHQNENSRTGIGWKAEL